MTNDRQRNIIAIALTIIFLGLLWILLLLFSLKRPYPPPPEYGVEVNLGNSIDGMGDIQPDISENVSQIAPSSSASQEHLATQDNSDVALPSQQQPSTQRPTQTTQETTQPQPEQPQQPQINQAALFPPRNPAQGGNEGTTGRPGDQGQEDGSKTGTAYSGTAGSGGGVSFNLSGRQASNLAKPAYDSPDQGTVVVRIWVNANGTVIRAEAGQRGTTVNDRNLWRTAEQAALRSSFTPDRNAPEQQVGTISYRFIKLN
ncbi:MAG: energy transducer TonB [Bacteroidales bacterium]|nr:energy transducer TonB [Bacteroidales bacterium]